MQNLEQLFSLSACTFCQIPNSHQFLRVRACAGTVWNVGRCRPRMQVSLTLCFYNPKPDYTCNSQPKSHRAENTEEEIPDSEPNVKLRPAKSTAAARIAGATRHWCGCLASLPANTAPRSALRQSQRTARPPAKHRDGMPQPFSVHSSTCILNNLAMLLLRWPLQRH